jgi:hypothetical protein
MTPAKRSRAGAHNDDAYESPDELEFRDLHAGSSSSRRSMNEAIRQVQTALIARWTMHGHGGSDKMTQRRSILTVLGKAPPPPKPMVSGRGTAHKKQEMGNNGRPLAWYHSYRRPIDREKYRGQVAKSLDLRRKLQQDNARMVCISCCEQDPDMATHFGYNPTTYLRNHLLSNCPSFKNSPAWALPEVVKELSKLHSKSSQVRLTCLM